jgi:TrmH family RNA methyltransferase
MSPAHEVVRSRSNPLFKRLRALRERGVSRGGDVCLLEGPRLIAEALAADMALFEAAAVPGIEERPPAQAVLATLRERGVPVRLMTRGLLESLSEAETPQGLVALARPPGFAEERLYDSVPLILLAVGIQDPGNLGGLLRTAEASGATGAWPVDGCAHPFSWKALRGSMGSAFRVPLARPVPAPEALDRLDEHGVRVIATAADGESRYDEVDLEGPVALAVGSEGAGLPAHVTRRAALRVRVPLAPPVESLNVGVAAGLVLFEAARQRGFPRRAGGR